MFCSEFQENHFAYIDGTMSSTDMLRAQRHMAACATCASHDASVRRALLVFRNLPTIEPSRDFSRKLNRRLAHARSTERSTGARVPAVSAIAIAAGLLITIVFAETARESHRTLSMPPAVATRPESSASHLFVPAIAASMTAGFPAWPAAFMVERASQQLHDAEFRFASQYQR